MDPADNDITRLGDSPIAKQNETQRLNSDPDFRDLPWIDMKGLDPLSVESLGQALLGWSAERASGEVAQRMLIGPPSNLGICVFVLPKPIVQALALLQPEQRGAVAASWMGGQETDVAKTALESLGDFAKSAIANRRDIYMWMSP
jgi:hypothetical protein